MNVDPTVGGVMPWHIEKHDSKFCVIKDSDGKEAGCHPTRDEAEAQMRALYANEPKVKSMLNALVAAYDLAHPFGQGLVTLEPYGPLQVAVAETLDQRVRGMAGRGFDGFDAMLFVQPVEAASAWHMQGVKEPLGLVLFDADGRYVWDVLMPAEPSFTVRPDSQFMYALEVPEHLYNKLDWSKQKLIR